MADQFSGDGMPEAPIGSSGDEDLNISNTGQRIRLILVLIAVVAVGVGVLMWYNKQQAQIAALEKVKTDFSVLHNGAYKAFWKAARLDLDTMKSNADFEGKIKEYLDLSAVKYAAYVKKDVLPLLEEAVPKYKAIETPASVAPEMKAVADSVDALLVAWRKFSTEIDMYEAFLDNRTKLDLAGDQWFGAQQEPTKEEFIADGVRYVNVLHCILVDKTLMDYEPIDLSFRVKDTCAKADEQATWFRRVAFNCLDRLGGEPVTPDELYKEIVKKYNKADPRDTKSKFAVLNCLDLSRSSYESELSDEIALAWANYTKSQNALLTAVAARIKEI